MLACRQLRMIMRADFSENVLVFFLPSVWLVNKFKLQQFLTELPVLADQTTRHLNSSNLNLLEHLCRPLDDSLNVHNIFLNRCEELNIPET